mgnify:CR=1 FL=1
MTMKRNFMRRSSTSLDSRKTCCIALSDAFVDMYAKCGALMNVCGNLRAVEKSKNP